MQDDLRAGKQAKLYELERRWQRAKEKRDKLEALVDGIERRYFGLHRATPEDLALARKQFARARAEVDRTDTALKDARAKVVGELVRLYPPTDQLAKWSEMTTWPCVYLDEQRAVFADQLARLHADEKTAKPPAPASPLSAKQREVEQDAISKAVLALREDRGDDSYQPSIAQVAHARPDTTANALQKLIQRHPEVVPEDLHWTPPRQRRSRPSSTA